MANPKQRDIPPPELRELLASYAAIRPNKLDGFSK